jgi:FAD/FMN-containing dehydrogenase
MTHAHPATPTEAEQKFNHGAIESLRSDIRGTMYRPGDEAYEDARKVWNGVIDKHPALVVRCSGVADVIASVKFAREYKLPVSVRSGGHNVSGSALCTDGVVIDLSGMRSVRVDPERKTVRAEGGATLGDIDHATQAFGRAVPMGVVSKTGIGGLTLHGGMGFLTRKYGLTSDNLISADVVTAEGNVITADSMSHSDLLWALRGGGGNFGVVTSFEFRTHPVGPDVWLALVFYPVDAAQKVLRFFRKFNEESPDELNGIALFWNAPSDESIPEAYRGTPVIILAACYCGEYGKGERAIQPVRDIVSPIADLSGPIPYISAQQIFDPDYPDGRRYYWKSAYLNNINDDVISALIHHAAERPSALTSLDVWGLGGAFSRVKPEETAFVRRNSPFLIGIESNWENPADDETNIAWARDVFRDLQRFSPGGAYLNFPGFAEEGEELMKKSYGDNYSRLQKIKATYDPDNFFRSNFNIQPFTG